MAIDAVRTRFTDLVGCRYPIMQGGMSSVAKAALVSAVSGAGGLGTLGAAVFIGDEKGLLEEIDAVRDATSAPFAVNVPLFMAEMADWLLERLTSHGVGIVETAGRSPAPFVERIHDAGMRVVHKATRVRDIVSAARAGVDAVCLLGAEAAGHTGPDQVATLVHARVAADQLRQVAPELPLLLGGGFADGPGLAAALALGADGVLLGTRFVATREAAAHDDLKARLVDARASDTLLAMASVQDHARILATERAREVVEAERRGASAEELFELYGDPVFRTLAATGDLTVGVLACGQAVGLVHEVVPAGDVVAAIVSEARAASVRAASLLAP